MEEVSKIGFKIRFCPSCGGSLQNPASLLNVFEVSTDIAYFCWCSACDWKGEIIEITRVIAPEIASN